MKIKFLKIVMAGITQKKLKSYKKGKLQYRTVLLERWKSYRKKIN